MRRLRDYGLTTALLFLFAVTIVGQLLSGWCAANQDAARLGQEVMALADTR